MNLLLVVLYLQNEFAAALNDIAGTLTLTVQCVGSNNGIAQILFATDHALCCLNLAVLTFALFL